MSIYAKSIQHSGRSLPSEGVGGCKAIRGGAVQGREVLGQPKLRLLEELHCQQLQALYTHATPNLQGDIIKL